MPVGRRWVATMAPTRRPWAMRFGAAARSASRGGAQRSGKPIEEGENRSTVIIESTDEEERGQGGDAANPEPRPRLTNRGNSRAVDRAGFSRGINQLAGDRSQQRLSSGEYAPAARFLILLAGPESVHAGARGLAAIS